MSIPAKRVIAFHYESYCVKINYPGTGNYSVFTFDARGYRTNIADYSGSSLTSSKTFVWCANEPNNPYVRPSEQRNGSGAITAQFFSSGETIGGTSYFYTADHLGSVRELTNSAGLTQSYYLYDCYGRTAQKGTLNSDFQYALYLFHSRSGLYLTQTRIYSPNQGRFLSRDPLELSNGLNLFAYVHNGPINLVDPTGLRDCGCPPVPNFFPYPWTFRMNGFSSITYFLGGGEYWTLYWGGDYMIHRGNGSYTWCDQDGNKLGDTGPLPSTTIPGETQSPGEYTPKPADPGTTPYVPPPPGYGDFGGHPAHTV